MYTIVYLYYSIFILIKHNQVDKKHIYKYNKEKLLKHTPLF